MEYTVQMLLVDNNNNGENKVNASINFIIAFRTLITLLLENIKVTFGHWAQSHLAKTLQ